MQKIFGLLVLFFFQIGFGQNGGTSIVVLEGEEAESAFAKANELYANENYAEAITTYQKILDSGQHSAEIYFNLGNAHYKSNATGEAIYHYEKALQLQPKDPEIMNNLAFAQRMRMDQIEELPESGTGSFVRDTLLNLTIDEWAYLGLVLLLIGVLFLILFRYTIPTLRKRLFFVIAITFFIGFLISMAAAFYSKNYLQTDDYAIIMDTEVMAREEPKNSAATPFTLHEGTKVQLLETYSDWTKVRLANGSRAWLPQASFRKL